MSIYYWQLQTTANFALQKVEMIDRGECKCKCRSDSWRRVSECKSTLIAFCDEGQIEDKIDGEIEEENRVILKKKDKVRV